MLKKIVRNLLLLFGSILFSLAIVELSLRALDISYPNFYQPDERRGYSLRPNAEGIFSAEGRAYVKINSQGLRAPEYAVEKGEGVFRVAVIGDSFAEAGQVSWPQTFASTAESSLETCPFLEDHRVEVINFGVGGYGTAQELLTWREPASRYGADIVLLLLFPGNDLRNNVRSLEQDQLRPYMLIQDGELVVDDSFRQTGAFAWRVSPVGELLYLARSRIRTLQVLAQARRLVQIWTARNDDSDVVTDRQFVAGLDNNVLLPPVDPRYVEAWQVTERILLQFQQEVSSAGAHMLIVLVPDQLQVHPDQVLRSEFIEFLGVDDLIYPNRRIRDFGDQHLLDLIDLTPSMLLHGRRTGEFLHGFNDEQPGLGHWNVRGNAFVGAQLAEEICRRVEEIP